MIVILVQTSNAFRVDNDNIYFLSILRVTNYWFGPNPEALGARIDCRTYSEALILLEI